MSRILYRIAAVLIVLLAAGHTAGYPWSDPAWGVDLGAMQSTHFDVMGSSRTYWDFYVGFGLSVSAFLLLSAVLAWQLGNVRARATPVERSVRWSLVLVFAAITALDIRYFFLIPIALSGASTIVLAAAAALAGKSEAASSVAA